LFFPVYSGAEDLEYSTYLGGSMDDAVFAMDISSSGDIYLTGTTTSSDFPTMAAWISSFPGPLDPEDRKECCYLTRLDSTGANLVFSTYIGGSKDDRGLDIDFFPGGDIVLLGSSLSPDFPTIDPYQASSAGSTDLVLLRFEPGGIPVFSTYFGGSGIEAGGFIRGGGIRVMASGDFVVGSHTVSSNFPTLNPIDGSNNGSNDLILARFSSGLDLLSSTYLGGDSTDHCYSLALGSDQSIYMTGRTSSDNFPTVNPYQAANPKDSGYVGSYVIRLNSAADSILYSSYLCSPGSTQDYGLSILVDDTGYFYVYGSTDSQSFPTRNACQAGLGGGVDGFLTKFLPDGSDLSYSTYLGGSGDENLRYSFIPGQAGLDQWDRVYMTGTTESSNFPTIRSFQSSKGGGTCDGFISVISSDGSSLEVSSYLGGSSKDYSMALAMDSAYRTYVAGYTVSPDFPTVNPYQAGYAGYHYSWGDGFISRLGALPSIPATPSPSTTSFG